MNAWLEPLNAAGVAWGPWLWRICWQGALVIAVAWLLTLLLRQRSARLRSWIWRLAYLKLLILLVWTSPVNLPLLPARESGQQNHKAATVGRAAAPIDTAPRLRPSDNTPETVASPIDTIPRLRPSDNTSETVVSPIDSAPRLRLSDNNPETVNSPMAPAAILAWQSYLLLAWSLGMVLVIGRLAWETWLALRLRRSARPVHSAQLEALVDQVRQQLGLRCTVQLAESAAAHGPMLIKFRSPCIVFPSGMLPGVSEPSPAGRGQGEGANSPSPLMGEGWGEGAGSSSVATLSPDEIRLVLAHELAHVKRHDLAWNALAAVVHVLLYFHPLVWLASRWARQEQELACDELVVLRMQVPAIDYGQTLIKIVQQISPTLQTGLVAVGMSGSFKTLSRRLQATKHIQSFTRRQVVLVGGCLAILAAVAIVPWRLVAQEAKPAVTDEKAKSPADPGAPASSATTASTDKAAREKLLVGTWRGSDFKLTFREDGTFSEFLVNGQSGPRTGGLPSAPVGFAPGGAAGFAAPGMPSSPAMVPSLAANSLSDGGVADRGNWQISDDGDRLRISSYRGVRTGASDDKPRMEILHPAVDYKIVRLDQSFLRLTTLLQREPNSSDLVEGDTAFYRRLPDVTSLDKLKGKLSDDVLHVAELAQMDSEEALALAAWMKNQNIQSAQLQVIEKTAAVEAGKLSLKNLFQWSDAEDQAYQELKKVSGLGMDQATYLSEQKLLSADEQSAVQKMKLFANQFAHICSAFNVPPAMGGQTGQGWMKAPTYPGSVASQNALQPVISLPPGISNAVPAPVAMGSANSTSNPDPFATRTTEENAAQDDAIRRMQSLWNDLQRWLGQGPLAN